MDGWEGGREGGRDEMDGWEGGRDGWMDEMWVDGWIGWVDVDVMDEMDG